VPRWIPPLQVKHRHDLPEPGGVLQFELAQNISVALLLLQRLLPLQFIELCLQLSLLRVNILSVLLQLANIGLMGNN